MNSLTFKNAELWILWTGIPTCRTDRQYLFNSTFNANGHEEHGALDKASKNKSYISDIPVHTRWVVYSSSNLQTERKMIEKFLIGLFCIFSQIYVDDKIETT